MLLDPRRVRLARWFEILDSIREAEEEEATRRLRQGAFLGWQFAAVMAGGKNAGRYGDYLKSLGLGFGKELPTATLVSKEDAMANAERVLAYYRKHPRKVLGRGKQMAAREARQRARAARRKRHGR